ncbi:MAG: lysophospholipid acyltransferase family protein [Isosphaeraceae bacterium]
MTPRDFFTWKTYFYRGLLPALRALGPERADAVLESLGRAAWVANPAFRRALTEAARRAGSSLEKLTENEPVRDLAAGLFRFLARDYLLETSDHAQALGRFDVSGEDALRDAASAGRGVILVGAHLGAHLSALHWFYRNDFPLRLMVQRPRHISKALEAFFDRDEADPQSGFFLRRGLGPTDCVERLLRVRGAVRSGKVVYFAGDVPWRGANTRPGRLLGQSHAFLAVWADLSSLTGTPVVFTFCNHRPGGRFALSFEPIGRVGAGGESEAVARFLGRLEDRIAARPSDAVAHLLWPCYGPSRASGTKTTASRRPGRREAIVIG